ncbi:cytochrome P450 [Xylaria sp. FL1042]|nr:cytochrome P450 [Xylaria sp. FL1042]
MSLLAASRVLEKLSWSQAALSVGGVVFLWYTVSSIAAWYRLRHIPGPFFASFSHIWSFLIARSGRSHLIIAANHKKYGRVLVCIDISLTWSLSLLVSRGQASSMMLKQEALADICPYIKRIAPDAITIFDPETLLRINSARSPYTRSNWYHSARIDYRGDSVISELDLDRHGKRKAKLAPAFTGKNVAVLEAKVDKWLASLVDAIRTRIAKGEETMEIGKLIQYFQVDMISELSMGRPWGDLKEDKDHFGYLRMSDLMVPFVQTVGFIPAFRAIYSSQRFMKVFGPKTTDTGGLGLFMGLLQDEVESRFSEDAERPKENRDLLDDWIKHGLPPDECQRDLSLLLPAGTETSVMMMRGTLLLLMSSPRVYWKLKQEIKDGVATGRISSPVTNEEARSLEYTQAVVQEGFRMMVPINFGFPKRVPDSGDTICGKFIPGGTDVFPNYHCLMRCQEVFGEDADSFRPERWLDGGPNLAYMSKVVDFAFGGGRFTCLGKPVAIIEMNKVFIELFRRFDFQTAKPEKPWVRKAYASWVVHDFWARVTEDKTIG